jgi:TolA-binding protein
MRKSQVRQKRMILSAIAIMSMLLAPSCVPGARYREVLAERDRLAKANLELQRTLTEERVRAQEAAEAHQGGAAATGAAYGKARGPASGSDPSSAQPPAALAPEGLAPASPAIADEDVHTQGQGALPADGAAGILKVARSYSSAGRKREAIDAYTRLVSDYPFSSLLPEAFIERARLRLAAGDRSGALEDFDTVAEAFPSSPWAAEARRQGDLLRH